MENSNITTHLCYGNPNHMFDDIMPKGVLIGNMIFEGKYHEAIDEGLEYLKSNPTDNLVMINLMQAYFKIRKENTEYLERSSYYAKQAMLHGHHTGYAEERLAKNLESTKQYHKALQLYDLILCEEFTFSPHGVGNFIDWIKRKKNVVGKLDKAKDNNNDILFTNKDIEDILNSMKE